MAGGSGCGAWRGPRLPNNGLDPSRDATHPDPTHVDATHLGTHLGTRPIWTRTISADLAATGRSPARHGCKRTTPRPRGKRGRGVVCRDPGDDLLSRGLPNTIGSSFGT